MEALALYLIGEGEATSPNEGKYRRGVKKPEDEACHKRAVLQACVIVISKRSEEKEGDGIQRGERR